MKVAARLIAAFTIIAIISIVVGAVGILKNGWFGDTSRMYFVGEPSKQARQLVQTTYEAMRAGILEVRPGATLGDIGHAIQPVARRAGYSVVREA